MQNRLPFAQANRASRVVRPTRAHEKAVLCGAAERGSSEGGLVTSSAGHPVCEQATSTSGSGMAADRHQVCLCFQELGPWFYLATS